MTVTSDYQRQPFHVRAYRWLRHKPLACVRFVADVLSWATGNPYWRQHHASYEKLLATVTQNEELTFRQWISHLWTMQQSEAEYRMGDYLTTEAMLEEYVNG